MKIKMKNRDISAQLLEDGSQEENYIITNALFDIKDAGKAAQVFINGKDFNCRIFPFGTNNLKKENGTVTFTKAILIGDEDKNFKL